VPANPNWQNDLGQVNLPNTTLAQNTTSENPGAETQTDTVSQSLVSNYLSLKQNGTLDSTSAQKLVDQTLNFIDQKSPNITLVSQLNVVPDNGKQSIT